MAILLSLVKMTSLISSLVTPQRWQYSSRLTLFASLTSWQYFVPVDNHPILRRVPFNVVSEIVTLKCSKTILTSSGAVVSSFLSIAWSTNSKISSVCLVNGRGFLIDLLSSPVVSYLRINLERSRLLIEKLCCSFKILRISKIRNFSRSSRDLKF